MSLIPLPEQGLTFMSRKKDPVGHSLLSLVIPLLEWGCGAQWLCTNFLTYLLIYIASYLARWSQEWSVRTRRHSKHLVVVTIQLLHLRPQRVLQ